MCDEHSCLAGPFKSSKHRTKHRQKVHGVGGEEENDVSMPSIEVSEARSDSPFVGLSFGGAKKAAAKVEERAASRAQTPLPVHHFVTKKQQDPTFDHIRNKIDRQAAIGHAADVRTLDEVYAGKPLPDYLMIRRGQLHLRKDNKKEDDWLYDPPEGETEEEKKVRWARLTELAEETEAKARAGGL